MAKDGGSKRLCGAASVWSVKGGVMVNNDFLFIFFFTEFS